MTAVLLFTASCFLLAAAGPPPVAGDWRGAVRFNGADQYLAIHLKQSENGWTGSMDATSSGVNGIPLAGIRSVDSRLSFQVPGIQGSYEGVLDAKTGVISGTWSQGGLKLPLDWHRATAGAGPVAPNQIGRASC